MSTEENKALVRRWFAETDQGTTASSTSCAHPTTSTTARRCRAWAAERGRPEGPNAALGAAFPDTVHIIEDQVAEGDKVVTRLRGRATFTGEILGIPRTARWSRSPASPSTASPTCSPSCSSSAPCRRPRRSSPDGTEPRAQSLQPLSTPPPSMSITTRMPQPSLSASMRWPQTLVPRRAAGRGRSPGRSRPARGRGRSRGSSCRCRPVHQRVHVVRAQRDRAVEVGQRQRVLLLPHARVGAIVVRLGVAWSARSRGCRPRLPGRSGRARTVVAERG